MPKVVPIQKSARPAPTKTVAANQKAIDALPLNSGTWLVAGVQGLCVRARARSKSFYLQRRVDGKLIRKTLKGDFTLKEARAKAEALWPGLKEAPPPNSSTLATVLPEYLDARKRQVRITGERTAENYHYNLDRYLIDWKDRPLHVLGKEESRPEFRALIKVIRAEHGSSTSNQVQRLVSALYRWQRKKIDPSLPPEPPTVAVEIDSIPARDWAYSDKELKTWWYKRDEKDGETIESGVKILGAIKRMWWLTALFTGARKGSIEALQWEDLDFDKKVIRFRISKGDRPYQIPMSEPWAKLLKAYQESGDAPPSPWVFPSDRIEGGHLTDVKNVREGVGPAHRLRHTFRTTLVKIGATPDQARLLMGHSMGGDVSRGYITSPLVVESLRPVSDAVADHYAKLLGL